MNLENHINLPQKRHSLHPRTGDVVAHVAEADAEDIDQAFAAARNASWLMLLKLMQKISIKLLLQLTMLSMRVHGLKPLLKYQHSFLAQVLCSELQKMLNFVSCFT